MEATWDRNAAGDNRHRLTRTGRLQCLVCCSESRTAASMKGQQFQSADWKHQGPILAHRTCLKTPDFLIQSPRKLINMTGSSIRVHNQNRGKPTNRKFRSAVRDSVGHSRHSSRIQQCPSVNREVSPEGIIATTRNPSRRTAPSDPSRHGGRSRTPPPSLRCSFPHRPI